MFFKMLSLGITTLLFGLSVAAPSERALCPNSKFRTISAADAFAGLNPGWNLGNTLDATPTEGSWNNPPVVPSTFDAIKAKGFKSIRIPG